MKEIIQLKLCNFLFVVDDYPLNDVGSFLFFLLFFSCLDIFISSGFIWFLNRRQLNWWVFFFSFIYFILIQCCVIWSKFKPVRNLHMISYKIPKPLPSNRIFKYILSRFPFGIPYYHYSIVAVPTISNKCSRPSFNLKLLLFA